MRFLFVMPLVLNRLSQTEISAWLLFGVIQNLTSIFDQRISLTFIRMVAFGMAGAKNLKPIKDQSQRGTGEPDWHLIENIYGTLGVLYVLIAVVVLTVFMGTGYFSLTNIVSFDEKNLRIWLAFVIFVLGNLVNLLCRRNAVTLQGMNYVALLNRWGIVFGFVNIVCSIAVLYRGGDLLVVVAVSQTITILSCLKIKWLLCALKEGNFKKYSGFTLKREVLKAAWEPTWRGLIFQLSHQGVLQIGGIIYTAHGKASEVASYLLALRIITIIGQFAQIPFSSLMPCFARLRAEGNIKVLSILMPFRIKISLGLFLIASLMTGFLSSFILDLISAKTGFVSLFIWMLMVFFHLHDRFNALSCAVCASANHLIFYWHSLAAGLVSIIALLICISPFGLIGMILSLGVPRFLIFNIGPIFPASASLNIRPLFFLKNTYLFVLVPYLIICIWMYLR